MNLEYLAHFLVITDHMNITKAARDLHFSQSTLSRQMASLEKQLGYDLFVRDGHTFQLTEAGELLAREGKSLINQLNVLKDRIGETVKQKRALSLSFSVISTAYILEACRGFSLKYPQINLSVDEYNGTGEILSNLLEDEVDIGMLHSYEISDIQVQHDDFVFRRIARDRMVLIVGKDHPLAAAGHVAVCELTKERILQPGHLINQHWNYISFACSGKQFFPLPQQQYSAKNKDTMLFLVKTGFGVAFMPAQIARTHMADVVPVEIDDLGIDLDLMLVWKKRSTNPALRLFTGFLETLPPV